MSAPDTFVVVSRTGERVEFDRLAGDTVVLTVRSGALAMRAIVAREDLLTLAATFAEQAPRPVLCDLCERRVDRGVRDCTAVDCPHVERRAA